MPYATLGYIWSELEVGCCDIQKEFLNSNGMSLGRKKAVKESMHQ